jgi:tetratricopeptide (TPR) repeat protein
MKNTTYLESFKFYIEKGHIEKALDEMKKIVSKQKEENDIILLMCQFNQQENDRLLGFADKSEYQITLNRIAQWILKKVEELENEIEVTYELGINRIHFYDYNEAIEYFDEILDEDPNNLRATMCRAIAKIGKGDINEIDNILNDFKRMERKLSKVPKQKINTDLLREVFYNRGQLLKKLGHPELAEEDFEKIEALGYE